MKNCYPPWPDSHCLTLLRRTYRCEEFGALRNAMPDETALRDGCSSPHEKAAGGLLGACIPMFVLVALAVFVLLI